MNWTVVPIAEEHIVGFHAVLDEVARERRWMSFLDAGLLEDTRQFVRNNIARHHPQFVAVRDGAVIGWADVVPASRPLYAHVGTLGMGIREAYRGQGLGKLLVLAALAGAKARGMTRIELTVREANLRAIGLYRSVGFVTEGIKRDAIFLDGQYENVLFMAVLLEDDRRGAKRPVAAAFAPPLNALDDLAVPVRGVLIDLDGTLVDTLGDFRAALDAMRVELSLGPLREHDVRQWVGRGSEYLVKQALAGDWSPDQMHADFDHALELYYQHYALANGRYSSLYPGVEEGLAALKDMGMVLACVTNKPRHFAVPLLQRFGIPRWIRIGSRRRCGWSEEARPSALHGSGGPVAAALSRIDRDW